MKKINKIIKEELTKVLKEQNINLEDELRNKLKKAITNVIYNFDTEISHPQYSDKLDAQQRQLVIDFSVNNIINYLTGGEFTTQSGEFLQTQSKQINQALTPQDIKHIRKLIRQQMAAVYFDLFKKRAVWSK